MNSQSAAHSLLSWIDVRRPSVHRAVLVVAFALLSFSPASSAAESPKEKNVLIIISFSGDTWNTLGFMEARLRSSVSSPVNFDVEFLEGQRFDDPGYDKALAEIFRQKYSGQKLDLVLTEAYPAFAFAARHRDELFPGMPIIFWDVYDGRIDGQKLLPGMTGVAEKRDQNFRATIDLALHVKPDTDTVAIITENSSVDRFILGIVHAELLRHHEKVREIDLVGLPTNELLERIGDLPPRTAILFEPLRKSSAQPAMDLYDLIAWSGQHFPTYCLFPEECLNHGGIGGVEPIVNYDAARAVDFAARVLSGERADSIPIVITATEQAIVDWRQLRRWNIKEASLAPGSVILNREPTLWERDKRYIIAALALIVVQAVLIMGLLWQRARKRKAEAVLRESEKRFRVMADTTPSIIWMCDPQGKITYLNERRSEFTGPDPSAGYGDSWTAYVHPDDLSGVLENLARALKRRETFSKEYRLRRHDGVFRWMFDVASPRINGDGSFAGFIGSAIDVTDHKLAQEALEKVSGRLIEAQEKERSRIARDLHDDICQRLILLSMALEQANRGQNGSPGSAKQRLEEIRKSCSEIANDVQSLSHELHSSKLDYLGIAAAIRGFCKEFAEQQEVTVHFTDQNVPKHLPRDVSLCLFRVAQEALHNAAKYSGVSRFVVELKGLANEVQLVVTDSGAGFNVDESMTNHGLGLVSMQERVHLVHGIFQIKSRLGEGTEVVVILPLSIDAAGAMMDDEPRKAASTEAA